MKADRILASIKEATPRIRNEQALTESIIAAITTDKKSVIGTGIKTFLDRLDDIFSTEVIRFACGFVILLCGMTYVFMEYNDTKSIVTLEHKLGKRNEMNSADVFQQNIKFLNFLRDFYNLSNGSASSVELSNSLVLIKKADLQALFKEYKTLDEASRARVDELCDKYKNEDSTFIGSKINHNEITVLRNEIERLKKELEQINLKRGKP